MIIPARLASTRLPNKALLDLGGKPMVVRTAERAMASGAGRVLVATDHQAIVQACAAHGIEAHMTRADHPSGTDRIAEVASALQLADDAVVVNVQGDEPLIDPALISATAAMVSRATPMATAAHPLSDIVDFFNPNVVKVVLDQAQQALLFSRAPIPWQRDHFAQDRSSFPDGFTALRHIGIYAYRSDFLANYPQLPVSPLEQWESLEQLRVLWNRIGIAVHIAAHSPAVGVDTLEDLQRVRQFF